MASNIDGVSYSLQNLANIIGQEDLCVDNLSVNSNVILNPSSSGIQLVYNNVPYTISPFEISNLKNSRSNLQQQIDILDPSLNATQISGILQRITDISYIQSTDTTDISGSLNVGNSLDVNGVTNLINTNILGNVSVYGNMRTSNLSVEGRLTSPAYVSPASNTEYTMKQYVDTQDGYYYGLNQSSINNLNNIVTGISYDYASDTTIIDNSVNIYGKLNIYVNNGSLVPLNSYIDTEVSKAYNHGTDAMALAQTAKDTADEAHGIAVQANTTATNNAIAIGVITGTSLPAIAGSLTSLQGQITGLGYSLGLVSGRVSVLETKTQNMNSVLPGLTTFTGQVEIGNTNIVSNLITTPAIDTDAVYTPTIGSNTGVLNITPAVQNLQGTTINVGGENSSVNIATTGINEVSIGNAFTPVYINGLQYVPFNLGSLTSLIRQVRPAV